MNKEETYQKLLEKYSAEELAESFIFSVDLPEEEQKKNDEEFWAFRKQLLINRTKEEQILSGLLQIKYQIEGVIESTTYEKEKNTKYLNYLSNYKSTAAHIYQIILVRLCKCCLISILNRVENLSF